jgi:opine dehydrogenase
VQHGHIRAKVDIASLPANGNEAGLVTCRALFGDRFAPRDDVIAIALSNLNPQNHLAIALRNLTRMERGEIWFQYANTTDAVGRLIEALDAERLAIADAFGVRVRTVREHFHLSFGAEHGPIGAMSRELAARGDTQAPARLCQLSRQGPSRRVLTWV